MAASRRRRSSSRVSVREVAAHVRTARASDVKALLAMMAPFNKSEGIPWRPRSVAGALRRLLGDARLGVVLVAESGSPPTIAGYIVATYNYDLEFAGSDAFVTELFVKPEARRAGIARRLLEAVTSKVRSAGAGALHLLVRPENRGARSLYEKAGFAEIPRRMMTKELPRRAVRLLAPVLVALATALPARANDGVHGFVDPCAVSFVEDNTNECELCPPALGDADACKTKLAPLGYALRCRTTPGHAAPGEVWCRPRPGFSLPRPPEPPEPLSRSWYFAAPVAVLAAFGAFWAMRRRGRKRRRVPG
jgi:ribosomal protein S18 acetylase RimI-like enzyme